LTPDSGRSRPLCRRQWRQRSSRTI
jgi:hypothetical protein